MHRKAFRHSSIKENLSTPDESLDEAFVSAFDGLVPEERQFLGGETLGHMKSRGL
jgi:probable phosphoglycerate mutase